MVNSAHTFGTDGIRGRVGKYPITPDFTLHLGWAIGSVLPEINPLNPGQRHRVVIGKDTRRSCYMLETAIQSGLIAAGVDVFLLGPIPTPAVAFLTQSHHASAGIVISASHNPHHDNGIKIFNAEGKKITEEVQDKIMALMQCDMSILDGVTLGKPLRINDAAGRYIEYCKQPFPLKQSLRGIKIVLDCANGASYRIAPKVFYELGATVSSIGIAPDGMNINADLGSTAPQQLQELVKKNQADIGIAFDGDADRVLMVDHLGNIVNGDDMLYIIAAHRKKQNIGKNHGVVGTQMSHLGLEHSLAQLKIGFERSEVGDRNVYEMMCRLGWDIGGESSGHIICADYSTTGDGIIAALLILHAMVANESSLNQLTRDIVRYPSSLINVDVHPQFSLQAQRVSDVYQNALGTMGSKGRVILRRSGTQSIVRILVEGESRQQVHSVANQLCHAIKQSNEEHL